MSRKITCEEASRIFGCNMSGADATGGTCQDFEILDNGIVQYMYIPGPEYDDPKEYILWQYDPHTGMDRHSGITPGCFFTDWE